METEVALLRDTPPLSGVLLTRQSHAGDLRGRPHPLDALDRNIFGSLHREAANLAGLLLKANDDATVLDVHAFTWAQVEAQHLAAQVHVALGFRHLRECDLEIESVELVECAVLVLAGILACGGGHVREGDAEL